MDPMTQEFVKAALASLVRHALTAAGATLVTYGVIGPGDQTAFVSIGSGIVVWAAGYVWSLVEKKGAAGVKANLDTLRSHLSRVPAVPSSVPGASAVNAAVDASKKM